MRPSRAPDPPARLNRALLGAFGLVLLVAGAGGLAAGLGLLRGLLPGLDPAAPLLREPVRAAAWTPWAAAAGGVVVGFFALLWLLAQARRRPTGGTWRLGGPGPVSGSTLLPTAAAASAVAHDIEGYRGTGSVTATVAGTRSAPALLLDVTVETGTSIADLRHHIAAHALPRLRTALQLDTLPTRLVLRLDTRDRGPRVR